MYRKFKADNIFNGAELLGDSFVLITDTDGTVKEIVKQEQAGDDVQTFAGILCPGFINCHCHIELSYLKNIIAPHTGLVKFVQEVLDNRNVDAITKLDAMRLAQSELHNSGTVAVADICNDAASVELKKASPLHWTNFIEISGFVNQTAHQRFATALDVAREFSLLPYPHAIVPHASYSVSENLFKLINEQAADVISIHNQETLAEDALYKNKSGEFLNLYNRMGIDISGFRPTGRSSLQSWSPYFTHGQKIISVHNTFISQDDIDFAKNLIYCLCINANLYIEDKLPPVDLLMKNECSIVIGTDSYASNYQLNMLEEMKAIQKNFPAIATETILKWATNNGAEALGIQGNFGSMESDKKPGIVLIENLYANNFTQASTARRIL